MTDLQWETLSNQGVAAAGVVYFLALLAYAVQWAALRDVPVRQAVAVGSGGGFAELALGKKGTPQRLHLLFV